MTKAWLAAIAATAALGLGGAAQAAELAAKIPFEFRAGNQTLPPGHYVVSQQTVTGVVFFTNAQNGSTAMVVTGRVQRGPEAVKGQIRFHRYGDNYYLSQIWEPGSLAGREVIRSKREAELALTSWPAGVEVMSVALTGSAGN